MGVRLDRDDWYLISQALKFWRENGPPAAKGNTAHTDEVLAAIGPDGNDAATLGVEPAAD